MLTFEIEFADGLHNRVIENIEGETWDTIDDAADKRLSEITATKRLDPKRAYVARIRSV
jgi:hypothetical protein